MITVTEQLKNNIEPFLSDGLRATFKAAQFLFVLHGDFCNALQCFIGQKCRMRNQQFI